MLTSKKKTFIIAEAGVNHNGSYNRAIKLANLAKKSGSDAVKFQTWSTDEIIVPNTKRPKYQLKDKKNIDQYNFAKKLELSTADFLKINKHCKKIGIKFLSTADDVPSAKFLNKIQNIFKIGSAEINNYQLLYEVCKFNKILFLSTGLSDLKEIKKVFKFFKKIKFNYKKKVVLMHCNSAYPTPFSDANLKVISELKKLFKVNIGFSDHTLSDECAVSAVALGAIVIEKHLTLDKNLKGPDHSTSLNGKEFAQMVRKIRNIEKALGSKIKKITKSAIINKKLMRRSIYATFKISKGEKFSKYNITPKRPAGGISPENYLKLLNRRSKFNYEKNNKIKFSELKH